jgi:S-DNA-T family DNA segregation ATPase FtsK/SpoIIIE
MKASEVIGIFEQKKEEKIFSLLKSFGIKTEYVKIDKKRFFDIYDIKLSNGIRSSKLDRVLVDIGLAMSSHSHPKGYPVMRDGVYRIEIQREEIESPTFQSVYNSFAKNHYAPIAVGVDTLGEFFSIDLNKLPNLLVAGTTGSGKSMLLHSFVLSLLGSDALVHLVDPKMVEFGIYENFKAIRSISHSVEETEAMIEGVRELMESRFGCLKSHGARDASEYNKKVDQKNKMRPVVVIVDEWADIVLQDKDIQKVLCFVAQKGRAAGISIILATQRPSARVISGLVKANFSGRVSLKVASAVDSRIVLDCNGAEKITDVGTGLYLDGTLSKPKMFRAPNILDIQEELNIISPIAKARPSFWSRFKF